MSDFRGGRSRGFRGGRGGGYRGSRGGFASDREYVRGGRGRGGPSRGRGDGFSRGRGGPRDRSRDDSPPRKMAMMSRDYEDSGRGRGPPMGRRGGRFNDGFDRGPPRARTRDAYSPPPRDNRMAERLSPPRRDRDFAVRDHYVSARGDYRDFSPPRESGGFRDTFASSKREASRDFGRPARDYPPRDFTMDRAPRDRDTGRDFRRDDMERDFREPAKRDIRDFSPPPRMMPRGGRGNDFEEERQFDGGARISRFEDRSFTSRDDRGSMRGPPQRDSRGSHRDSRGPPRDGRGPPRDIRSSRSRGGRGFMNGGGGGFRGRGSPRGRGKPSFGDRAGGRRSPLGKRPRMEKDDSYGRR